MAKIWGQNHLANLNHTWNQAFFGEGEFSEIAKNIHDLVRTSQEPPSHLG